MVKAELASVTKDSEETIYLYKRAILLAEENGFVQDVALTNLCTAHYYMNKRLPKSGETYLIDSYLYYVKWGAYRLANNLQENFPEILNSDNRG